MNHTAHRAAPSAETDRNDELYEAYVWLATHLGLERPANPEDDAAGKQSR